MSTPSTSPLLKGVYGASLVGIMVSGMIFGLLTMQTLTYFSNYRSDKAWYKCLVAAVWIVQAFQIASSTHVVYYYLVNNFGIFSSLTIATWDYCVLFGQVTVVALLVQLFFVRRLLLLAPHLVVRWILVTIIITLSLLSFAFGMLIMAKTNKVKKVSLFAQFTWAIDLWLASASAADLIIALSMCYFLHKSRTGVKTTDRLIGRLKIYVLQTGALTSLTELFCLITYTVSGFHYGHVVLIYPLGGFYATSLLASLNARHSNAQSLQTTGGTHVLELSSNVVTSKAENSTGTGSSELSGKARLNKDGLEFAHPGDEYRGHHVV